MMCDLPAPVTDDLTDGEADTVFGVLLTDDQYEAHRGALGFRGGKLVRVRIGRLPAWQDDDGLTIGVTLLSTPAGPAVTRVYVGGALDCETVHQPSYVNTDRL